jgi:hypothetical protein
MVAGWLAMRIKVFMVSSFVEVRHCKHIIQPVYNIGQTPRKKFIESCLRFGVKSPA